MTPADDLPPFAEQRPDAGEGLREGSKWSWYARDEETYFRRMSRYRYERFGPALERLARLGVMPWHITAASFTVLLVGFPILFSAGEYGAAFLVLALHIVLDGLDGPLARVIGRYGRAQGALLDMANDLTGMVIVVLTASFVADVPGAPSIPPTVGTIYVVTYLYVSVFAVAQNLLEIPYTAIVKTKFTIYALLLLKWLTGLSWITPLMVVFSVYMGVSAFLGFVRIARALREPD
ncbi:MAG: CDP-alcohol phosphatidyltransferase family protein [Deltaproteobacteria bacterium]|nr:CDP-alcohol phosphatidyltransferase family protein [Deltaproteobacteria bacterium]MCB9490316.1 CDP-alcohol phosphatidyltransferase family protein [Deltaproteobacteria bacterium]